MKLRVNIWPKYAEALREGKTDVELHQVEGIVFTINCPVRISFFPGGPDSGEFANHPSVCEGCHGTNGQTFELPVHNVMGFPVGSLYYEIALGELQEKAPDVPLDRTLPVVRITLTKHPSTGPPD